jgi:hypothetical protein
VRKDKLISMDIEKNINDIIEMTESDQEDNTFSDFEK